MSRLRMRSALFLGVALLALGCSGSDSTGPSTGNVQVSASTTGADLDPDGYTVAVDGGAGKPLGVNGSVTFSQLSVGDHTVTLSGIAANCTVEGQNPDHVSVNSAATTQLTVHVSCTATTGAVQVIASTTGSDLDPDGYTVAVDGGAGQALAVNGSVTFSQLKAGDHFIALSGVALNCRVASQNPMTVVVDSGSTTQVAYQVACVQISTIAGMIAFMCQWFTSSTVSNFEICVMHPDGTGLVNLTNNDASDWGRPAWSPDGSKIAFTSDRNGSTEIYVMNADGSGVTRLTYTPQTYSTDGSDWPAWSPDGSKIAFRSSRDGGGGIYVMNADGSGITRLTDSAELPVWSPDGSKIAFMRWSASSPNADIYVMNADGTSQVNLTNSAGVDDQCGGLSWSPDGSKIGFGSDSLGNSDTCRHTDIYVMNPDGTALKRLTSTGQDSWPSWSPDGTKIAFQSFRDGWNIYVMNADGTGVVQVTNQFGFYEYPAWRP